MIDLKIVTISFDPKRMVEIAAAVITFDTEVLMAVNVFASIFYDIITLVTDNEVSNEEDDVWFFVIKRISVAILNESSAVPVILKTEEEVGKRNEGEGERRIEEEEKRREVDKRKIEEGEKRRSVEEDEKRRAEDLIFVKNNLAKAYSY